MRERNFKSKSHRHTSPSRGARCVGFVAALAMTAALFGPGSAVAASVSFGPKTDFATGVNPSFVTAADLNGDGVLDLAVANAISRTVSVLLGDGTGNFGPKTDFGTGSLPVSIAVGDFDGNGTPDLAVANYASSDVSVLLGDGTGSFGPKTDFSMGSGLRAPTSVAAGDFDENGTLDLAVAVFYTGSVAVLLGDGAGSFGPKTDYATGYGPNSVAIGDFDGNGTLDLAVANGGTGVSVLLGDGTGTFGPKTDYGTTSTPPSLTAGDFDNDGALDLAVVNFHSDTVSVLLGDGTGSFGPKTDYGTGPGPYDVATGDFDLDGALDLVVANDASTSVSVLQGDGSGSFGTKTDFDTGPNPDSVAIGDFDGDGAPDLAVTILGSASVSVLLNTSSRAFDFTGFFAPVDNSPVLNVVKGGQAIPVRFSLGGDQGLSIFEASYPKSQQVPCDAAAPVDGVEETVTAGASGLSYDATSDQYSYVWKTETGWANTCRQFVIKLTDGTYHRATFKFR